MSDLPPVPEQAEIPVNPKMAVTGQRIAETVGNIGGPVLREAAGVLLPQAPPNIFGPPDADEVFGTLPDVDEVFALPKPWYSKSPALNHFAQGFSRIWDATMSEEAKKELRDTGVFNQLDGRIRYYEKTVLEGLHAALMTGMSTLVGLGEAAVALGVPREVPAAVLEVFPAGRLTGLPLRGGAPLGRPSPAMERILPLGAPLDLDVAAELGVFGRRPSELTAMERFAPNADLQVGRTSEAAALVEPVPLRGEAPGEFGVPAPEIPRTPRETAAALDPPLFEAYDAFTARRNELLRLIEEEAEAQRNHPTAQSYIDAAMSFLRKGLAEADEGLRTLGPQVGAAIRDVEAATRPDVVAPSGVQTTINRLPGGGFEVVVDTPTGAGRITALTAEAAEAQAARLKAEYAQREAIQAAKADAEAGKPLPYHVSSSGRVSVAMDGERVRLDLTPEERTTLRHAELARDTSVRAEDVARHDADAQAIVRRGVDRLVTKALPIREKPGVAEAQARLEGELTKTGNLSSSDIQREFGVGYVQANRIRDRMIAKNAEALRTLYQRNGTISTDAARKLVEVGRPEAEAKAAARILQSMYEAHAARFRGELGSAWDIYQREGPRISGPRHRVNVATDGRTLEQGARGKIRLADPSDPRSARALITLFKQADPSTFMHETAHDWLERLVRDARHGKAPSGLIDDVAAIREWLGIREGEVIPVHAHEQFATGFERYLLEGTAPTKGLARVFQQFKEWLTSIYQGGIQAGVPINDQIRGVFDRMLAPEREPIIAPERPTPVDPAVQARATPPHLAGAKADDVLAEREAASGQLRAEIADGRRTARSGEPRTSVPPGGVEDPKAVFKREAGIGPDDNVGEGRTVSSRKSETPQGTGEGFGPADRPLIDYEGNIRVENIQTADDVRQVIVDASGERSGFMEARRNILTDAETIRLAEDLGIDPKLIDKWSVGQAWTAEQVHFARILLRDSATRVRDLALRAATKTDETTLLDYVQARQTHMMIQEAVSGATAEAGRALRAFRFLRDEGNIADINNFLAAEGKNLEALRREARELSQFALPQQVSAFLAKVRGAGWGNMFTEAWINSLVSGPHTHLVNTGTNAGVMLGVVAETGVAAAVGRVFRLFGREQGVTALEAIDRAHGISMGSVDGLRGLGAILKDENNIPIINQMQGNTQAIPGIVGKVVRVPGRFLAAEDQFFKAVAFQQEINVQARRIAMSEGHTGGALASRIEQLRGMPTPEMLVAAREFSLYQTFQNPLGRYSQWILNLSNVHPLMRLVLPFVRTPINLLKYAVERGPLGLFSRQVWDNMAGINGAVARDTQISRMIVGNMVGLGVGYLALNGLITGGGPIKDEEQMTLRMTGWQPYSVRIGDLQVSYRRFDPFSNTVGVAADLASLAKTWVTDKDEFGRDFDVDRFTTIAGMTFYRNIIDKMSLRGITGLTEAIVDYERNGKRFINGLVGSMVPAVVGQTARALDPFEREARDAWSSIQSRLPWMREDLMPKRDRWGEPFMAGAIGPLQIKMVNEDPVNQALLALGINVDQPRRQISGVELTARQYDDYVRISGRLAKSILDGIMTPQFRAAPAIAQIEAIKGVISSARAMGRAEVGVGSLGSDEDIIQQGLDLRLQALAR